MRRAPAVLLVTAAATAGVLSFHPHRPATPLAVVRKSGTTVATGGRTVTGAVETTQYGPVQVRVSVSGGRVTNVEALQAPANDPRSSQINAYAVPLLRQEALKAQSGSIDGVSGATYTSEGYEASLQSALNRAGV